MEVPQKKGIMYVYKLAIGNQSLVTDSPKKPKKAASRGIWKLRKSKTYRENSRTVELFEERKPSASNVERQGSQDGSFKNIEGRKSTSSNIEGQGQNGTIKILEGRKLSTSNIEKQGGKDGNYKILEGRKSCASNIERQGGKDSNYKIIEGRKSCASNIERQGGKDGNYKIIEGRKSCALNIERQGGKDSNYKIIEGRKSCALNIERQGGKDGNYKIIEGRKSCASNIERQGGQDGDFKSIEGRKSVSHVEACDSSSVAKFLQVKVLVSDMPVLMQVHAFRCARRTYDSLEKFSSKHMAYNLKKDFDKVYGPAWHCIVGSSFGSFVTHSTGSFLYFSIHNIYILIFKTKVQRALD